MKDDLKVFTAGAAGIGASVSNLFVSNVEPFLRLLVLVGQVGVAAATIFYIWTKIKALKK